MTTERNRAFEQLRVQWLRHDDLRRTGATIAELWASRAMLDGARAQARRAAKGA